MALTDEKVEQAIRNQATRWRVFIEEADALAAKSGRSRQQALEDLLRAHVRNLTNLKYVGTQVVAAYRDADERVILLARWLQSAPGVAHGEILTRVHALHQSLKATAEDIMNRIEKTGEAPSLVKP